MCVFECVLVCVRVRPCVCVMKYAEEEDSTTMNSPVRILIVPERERGGGDVGLLISQDGVFLSR